VVKSAGEFVALFIGITTIVALLIRAYRYFMLAVYVEATVGYFAIPSVLDAFVSESWRKAMNEPTSDVHKFNEIVYASTIWRITIKNQSRYRTADDIVLTLPQPLFVQIDNPGKDNDRKTLKRTDIAENIKLGSLNPNRSIAVIAWGRDWQREEDTADLSVRSSLGKPRVKMRGRKLTLINRLNQLAE
jgi:hypothetical protein